jgi:hypothetical protein
VDGDEDEYAMVEGNINETHIIIFFGATSLTSWTVCGTIEVPITASICFTMVTLYI